MKLPQAMIYLFSSSHVSFLFYGLAIICLTFATFSASYGGNETDYHALLSFKSKITHDPYKVLMSWNHSFHFCDWSGISCGKRHKRVTALQLRSQGLEGSLSPHIGNLSFPLGSIPKEMSLLSKLARLVIQDNKLTGGIPPFLGNITSMEAFSAVRNPLGGSIPDTLEMFNNNFSGMLTIDFSKLRDINTIHLDNNKLNGRGEAEDMRFIDSLKNCSRLEDLGLMNCNLMGVLPISIGNLSDQPSSLGLADNQLFGSLHSSIGPIPAAIGNLSLLAELYLQSNKLEGHIPPTLGNYKELIGLELLDNRLSGKIPKQLLQLPSLTNFLNLSQNSLSSIPLEINDLKMLSHLDLS
nr:leucine-rich repeat protein [Tanacetum cinerariifolium]